MKTTLRFALLLHWALLFSSSLTAQLTFSNGNHLLTTSFHNSGHAMGIADMNADGLDDLLHLLERRELYLDTQTADGAPMISQQLTSRMEKGQWMLTVGDVDNNGFNDIMTGGAFDTIKIFNAD